MREARPLPGTAAGPRSLSDLFVTFTLLALQGFGGVMVVAQQVLCERRRWMSRAEFLELFGMCQVVPGPSLCNFAVIYGQRTFGWRGAVVALSGLCGAPLALVLALAVAYAHSAGTPAVAGALRGMGAVSAGLVAGTAAKLAGALRASPLGVAACVAVGVSIFALVALLRLPLATALVTVGSASCALAWRRTGPAEGGR